MLGAKSILEGEQNKVEPQATLLAIKTVVELKVTKLHIEGDLQI